MNTVYCNFGVQKYPLHEQYLLQIAGYHLNSHFLYFKKSYLNDQFLKLNKYVYSMNVGQL